MNKLKLIALGTLLITQLQGATTNTMTTFAEQSEASSDKYGNSVYERDVTIKTDNFKVDNFWSKFSNANNGASEYTNISKTGTMRIVTESTSACVLDATLPKEGCSGQKPFLLNDEVLANPIVGTTDEFEVAFGLAADFKNTEKQSFYPLDILRTPKYYQDPAPSDSSSSTNRGFFGFFTSIFDFMFDKVVGMDFFGTQAIADVEYTNRSAAAQDRRERYLANIIAGIEKEQRIVKEFDGEPATQIEAGTKLNEPASLLHYAEAKKTTDAEQCKFMFLNLSNEGFMCRVMSGFGMDAWMPFFNQSKSTKIEVNTIMADTENALLAMTGTIDNVPYMQDVGGTDNQKLTFLQNILKPMITMVDFMKNMLFGSSKKSTVATPVERIYEFDKPMTISMAITNDGTQVDDFASFELLKIRSVYGDMINSCKVKKSLAFFSPPWTKTFYEDGTQSVKSPISSEMWNDNQWISWCQSAAGNKGVFDALFNWSTGGVFNPMNWMKTFFNIFSSFFSSSYSIEDFTSSLKRGLILDIKKVELDPLSDLNQQTIEIIKIQ